MEPKRTQRMIWEAFGAMVLFISIVLFTGMVRRPDLFQMAMDEMPVLLYAGVGLLGLGWIVTVGLFFGRGWARTLAGVAVAFFLVLDYFQAADQVSQSQIFGNPVLSALLFRLGIVIECLIAAWGLGLLYLLFAPRSSEAVPSSLSVEVLKTK